MNGVTVKLALFDLDNTLLSGDSDFEWAQFLIGLGVIDRELYEAKNQAFYDHYKAGTLDIHEFLDFQLKPLSRHSRRVLDGWHEQFMRDKVQPMMGRAAQELVDAHRADRARLRGGAPDRHRTGAEGRRIHRRRGWRTQLPRG